MTKYGRSPWVDRFPKSRVPSLPKYRGPQKIDVVIIGGGLTGCTTAYAFAAAGVKVMLLEAAQIFLDGLVRLVTQHPRDRRADAPGRRVVLHVDIHLCAAVGTGRPP